MKRTLSALLAVLILLTAATGAVIHTVDAKKEHIVFTEQILAGDSAHLDGLSVSIKAGYGSALSWDLRHTIGQNPKTEAEFSLHGTETEYAVNEKFGMYVARDILVSSSHPIGEPLSSVFPESTVSFVFREAFESLLAEARQGKPSTQQIPLSDYFDYYPIEGTLMFSGFDRGNDGTSVKRFRQMLNDYFRIPVLKEEMRTLSVVAEADKLRYEIKTSGLYFDFMTQSVFTDDACYFIFDNKAVKDDARVDTSLIPGGYGIYKLTLTDNDLDTASLSTVFSLDEKTSIRTLDISRDKKSLYLITEENGIGILRILDADTMRVLYCGETDLSLFYEIYSGENYVLLQLKDQFRLIVCEDGVSYHEAFSFRHVHAHPLQTEALLYRDDTLVIVEPRRLHSYSPDAVGFSVAIYDDTGLLCHAEYDCNLDHPYAENELTGTRVQTVVLSAQWTS